MEPTLTPAAVSVDAGPVFAEAAQLFLSCYGELGHAALYRNDLIELVAQAAGGWVDGELALAGQSIRSGEQTMARGHARAALDMLGHIDAILNLRPDRRLETWSPRRGPAPPRLRKPISTTRMRGSLSRPGDGPSCLTTQHASGRGSHAITTPRAGAPGLSTSGAIRRSRSTCGSRPGSPARTGPARRSRWPTFFAASHGMLALCRCGAAIPSATEAAV